MASEEFEVTVHIDGGDEIKERCSSRSAAAHQAWQIASRGVGRKHDDGSFVIYPPSRILAITVLPVKSEDQSGDQRSQ